MHRTTSYYVWYRLAVDPRQARAIVGKLQREVANRTGVNGRLLARDDAGGTTWMEIYEDVADPRSFEATLDAVVVETGAQAIAPAGRHTERFSPLV